MSHAEEPHRAVGSIDAAALAERLTAEGVRGLQVGWVDNNGIVRSRVVPTSDLEAALRRGVGVTAVFAVFDSHDGITFAHEGLATPSGDVRLVPAVSAPSDVVALAGQPGLAWAHGRQLTADGDPWPYCQRTVLERTVARLADAGFEARAGFEIELYLSHEGEEGALLPAHRGPAYSANAVRDAEDFVVGLLGDLEANGLRVGQVHAEYGGAQV
jgi:glutamine synthetase